MARKLDYHWHLPQVPVVVEFAGHQVSLQLRARRIERRAECLAQRGVYEVTADVGVDRGRGVTAMPDLLLQEPTVDPVLGQVGHVGMPQRVQRELSRPV